LIAYTLWGVLPVYFKAVESVPAIEILLHRVIWAVPFGALIILLRKQWSEVRRALTHREMLLWLIGSAFLIAINWYIYIVAVQTDRIFQASLGYYINPLIFVLAGVVFFGERLGRLQTGAVLLAAVGVLVLTFSGGEFPWIALSLGTSFAFYGVIRKRVVIGATPGLFVETLILAPIVLLWLGSMMSSGDSAFVAAGPGIKGLLLAAGPITVVPLVMFAVAARRLALSTVGFMQFLAPTMQFATGIYYGEELTLPRLVCFACIWFAVVLFIADTIRQQKQKGRSQKAPA
jgi:chloramphenicol-sensitive protein RarD